MSKKKKLVSKNTGKKNSGKKASAVGGKKTAKPSTKKNASKKPAVKPAKVKKPLKPLVKKSSVKASKPIKKTPVPKKAPAKKTTKAPKSKVVAKNTKAKKASKPIKLKKSVPVKKPSPKKPLVKKVVVKKVLKPAKKVAKVQKPVIAKKIEAKKEIQKPIKAINTLVNTPKKESPAQIEKAKKIEELSVKKQLAEKKAQEVLAITNTIPVKAKNEISLSKIASISHSITNPIKKTDSYAVKPEKEPNGKFELEFVVHSSAEMLYEFLSTPSGLSEWFCDDLNIRNGIYTFIWDDQLQQARLLKTVELHLVRFQWVDKTDGSYFEFRIQRDDLTNDISLIITDFADSVSERESSKLLWHSQIEKLMHVIGSIF
jgi:uncharacterized protein YndB with AHSA1/START domain